MLKLLLLRFWPVWLPLLGYLIWLAVAVRRARKEGRPRPRFFDGPWTWMVIATLLLIIGMFVWMGISGVGREEVHAPSTPHGGQPVPGQAHPAIAPGDSASPAEPAAEPASGGMP